MSNLLEITSLSLEGIHYISFPPVLSESAIAQMDKQVEKWSKEDVKLHVLDMQKLQKISPAFAGAVLKFSNLLKPKGTTMISINMSDAVVRDVEQLGLEAVFNRIKNYPGDLYEKKKIPEGDMKRLLFKYLAQATFAAVEVALNSTVSCDENYSAKPAEVPWSDLDLISLISVNNDFVRAEFRLCCSTQVLDKLARSMLGKQTKVDQEVIDSMASELLNIIYGHAKSNLNEKESFNLPSAIPRLLRKSEFTKVKRSPPPDLTIMPMVTPMGSFYIEVDFGKQQTH